jgi:hypothetical protein
MTERWVPPRRWQYDRGMFLTSDGGRAFTRDDLIELQRVQRPQEAPSSLECPSGVPEPETAVSEAPSPAATAEAEPYVPGVGMRLSREVKALILGRNVPLRDWPAMSLAPSSSGPQLLKGVASETAIDLEHTMLMPNALRWKEPPPLRLRHGDASVGEIIDLKYVGLGSTLQVTCRVDDPEAARMPAFSIGFTPERYELVDRGGPHFHFRVDAARLIEISLVERPCLRSAIVTSRCSVSPNTFTDPTYRALQNQIALLKLNLLAA